MTNTTIMVVNLLIHQFGVYSPDGMICLRAWKTVLDYEPRMRFHSTLWSTC